jgi:hypothetical protein
MVHRSGDTITATPQLESFPDAINSEKINTSLPLPPLSMCRAAVLFAGEGTLELLMGIMIYNSVGSYF